MTCSYWPRDGQRCAAPATRRLYAPDGEPVPGGCYCRDHAEAISAEYRQKLAEDWPSVEIDENGRPVPAPAIPVLHTENGVLFAGSRPVLKAWESFKGWFWLGVEEVEPGLWFGLVQGFEEEWGYFSTEEMRPFIQAGEIWPIKAQDLPHAGRRARG